MRFYNRENELAILSKADKLKKKQSIFTIIIGRRRVGKTALTLEPFEQGKKVYLFVSKKDEHLLTAEFVEQLRQELGVEIFGEMKSFEMFFGYVMHLASEMPFTLIIDEFQELARINPSIYATIQKIWDRSKNSSHLHLIACGSVYSLMKKAFEDNKEPLFGRADFKIDLKPFTPSVLAEILRDHEACSPENFLDFYAITGGVAKYVELFVLQEAFDFESMLEVMISPNSLFLTEGRNRLIEEFGKEYGTYFSILSLIASSKTSKSEIESILEKNISGHLTRLQYDYNVIRAVKPIDAKPNTKVQKYEITDNFLAFWFRFIFKYQSLIEANNFERLKTIIRRDFSTFKGRILERLFVEIFKETHRYTHIGSYWERGNKNEIDIVAVDDEQKHLLICEVKLSAKRLNRHALIRKSQKLIEKYKGYDVGYRLLSIHDLDEVINAI